MIDFHELISAHQTARRDLLAQRDASGHWEGRLSASALSTATAVSALSIVARETSDDTRRDTCRQIASRGIEWLAHRRNDDGGWGDTDLSFSNISTTMLVEAAFHLAGVADDHADLLTGARHYIDQQGGVAGLRQRYGDDKTFAVPILTNAALAGLVPWKEVSPLPFEVANLPFSTLRLLRLPVVSYAIPALVAIGQARYFHRKPLNPLTRIVRRLSIGRSMAVLGRMQPASGGYLEATPLTSFVVMSLAATGRADHEVTRNGVRFLWHSIRDDGSWPIDTNLATWNTSLAVNALAATSGDVGALGCLDWLLKGQHQQPHPFTEAAPGGWGWTDLSGAVPDADDTSGALLALLALRNSGTERNHARIDAAAGDGLGWLLDLQNDDGGWPTFCRGWGTLPFDRSSPDLTAHALRALHAWRALGGSVPIAGDDRVESAVQQGLDYLAGCQRTDGSWVPLWFGNQHRQNDENPVYGTSRVLLAYRDLDLLQQDAPRHGLAFLAANACADGGWGSNPTDGESGVSSVEETALAVEALLADPSAPSLQTALEQGLRRLTAAVQQGHHHRPAPIGFYFAKLWYYEGLYPLVFTTAALGQAVRRLGENRPSDDDPTS